MSKSWDTIFHGHFVITFSSWQYKRLDNCAYSMLTVAAVFFKLWTYHSQYKYFLCSVSSKIPVAKWAEP